MKKLLISLCLLPLAGPACGDDGIPQVAGEYQVLKTDCEDESDPLTGFEVKQAGNSIQLFFEENDAFEGTVDEVGNFQVKLDIAQCTGRFSEGEPFDVNCSFGGESCTLTVERL